MVTNERVNGCAPLAGRGLANRYPRVGRRTICVPRPERNLTLKSVERLAKRLGVEPFDLLCAAE